MGWCLMADQHKDCHMKWVTPAAVVLRFGMEINSYIANR
jgi:coenzyme PQQ precursor peptide PqqA